MQLLDLVPCGICRQRPLWYLLREIKILLPECRVDAFKIAASPFSSVFCWEVTISTGNRQYCYSRIYSPEKLEHLVAQEYVAFEAYEFVDCAWIHISS